MKTIVGLYTTVAEANKVKSSLESQGYESKNIRVIDQTGSNTGTGTSSTSGEGIGAKIKDFFGSFSGSDEREYSSYTQGVSNGGALLAVTVADGQAERTADILDQSGAMSIDGGSNAYGSGAEDVAVLKGTTGSTGSAGYTGTANTGRTTGEQVIPIVEEELQVGKRTVQRGGVRIYSHVVSTPVSENVSLHDEKVIVDRQRVDRPATDADFTTGAEAIEVRAMGEEAVVGKRSRVVEEVRVGKEASDRTEQITDTVRRTEVDIEPTTTTETTGYTGSTTGTGTTRR